MDSREIIGGFHTQKARKWGGRLKSDLKLLVEDEWVTWPRGDFVQIPGIDHGASGACVKFVRGKETAFVRFKSWREAASLFSEFGWQEV